MGCLDFGEDMVSGRESYGGVESVSVPGYSVVAFPVRLELLGDRLIPACAGECAGRGADCSDENG